MRNFLFFLFLSLVFIPTLFITSCQKDLCKKSDCGTNGTCNPADGACVCKAGYEVNANSGKCEKISLCKNVDCGLNGHCDENTGTCTCDAGYVWSYIQGKCIPTPACLGINCMNGSCDENTGLCICNEGYERDAQGRCTIEKRHKFLGTWSAINCGATAPHFITITPINPPTIDNIYKISISNYGNASCSGPNDLVVAGTVSADGMHVSNFTENCSDIDVQPTGNSMQIDANKTQLTCIYTFTVMGTTYNCALVYTKQ